MRGASAILLRQFFAPASSTYTYPVASGSGREAVLIDFAAMLIGAAIYMLIRR